MVLLKYWSNFWRTPEIPLINCKINIFLIWSDQELKFAITGTKLYLRVVTLSAKDNESLLQQLKTGFKRIINWNKYQSEPKLETRNWYLNYLIDPNFQGKNRLFVLSFANDAHRRSYKRYFLSIVEIKD